MESTQFVKPPGAHGPDTEASGSRTPRPAGARHRGPRDGVPIWARAAFRHPGAFDREGPGARDLVNSPALPRDPLFQRSWWAKRLEGSRGRPTPRGGPEAGPLDPRPPGGGAALAHARRGAPLRPPGTPAGVLEPVPTRIRCCGPADPPELDAAAAREGVAEIVVQEVAGRRLEDRVLDMVSTFRVARSAPGLDARRVAAPTPRPGQDLPDELRIAQQLSDWNFC